MHKELKPNLNEKRGIDRILLGKSKEFVAQVTVSGKSVMCQIVDFHFEGIRLQLPNDVVQEKSQIEKLQVLYGKSVVAEILQPEFLRKNKDGTISLRFENEKRARGMRGKNRLIVKDHLAPTIMCADPIKIGFVLNFKMLNFTSEGLQLETSLSNKHLLQGMTFSKATVLLPGVDIIEVSFKIISLIRKNGKIRLGCKFIDTNSKNLEALARFGLFATVPDNSVGISEKFLEVKKNISNIKNLKSAVRIEVVTTPSDYAKVLNLRYRSYLAAQKLESDSKIEDMADEFDQRAIIVVAKIDSAVVATFRLVSADANGDKFPFESYVDFDSLRLTGIRKDFYEVSRLAVDPNFQGTDVLVSLFKEVPRLAVLNEKSLLCIAAKSLRKNYFRIGFRIVSKEVPHKVLKNDTMAVMHADASEFLKGKHVAAITYDLIVMDVLNNLHKAGIVKRPKKGLGKFVRKQIELLLLKTIKLKKRYTKVSS